MSLLAKARSFILKILGRPVKTTGRWAKVATVAMLSTSQALLQALRSNLATDLGQIKDQKIREMKAKSEAEIADAQRRTAEAAEASRKGTIRKQKKRLRELELEEKQAVVDAKKAEARAKEARVDEIVARVEKARAETQTKQAAEIAKAMERLADATSRLRQEGGDLILNSENLRAIANWTNPSAQVPAADRTLEAAADPPKEKPVKRPKPRKRKRRGN